MTSIKQAHAKATAAKRKDAFVPPIPTGGPGSPIDIVFSFDTTGSMSGCIAEVRKRVQEVRYCMSVYVRCGFLKQTVLDALI